MKHKIFDVVVLKNGNKAVILNTIRKNEYFCEIVNANGKTVDKRIVKEDEIKELCHNAKKI